MKQLALLVALLIIFAPMPTRAAGPKCEPPNSPDDYQPICPEFGSSAPYPYEFDPSHPPGSDVWDPNHPSMTVNTNPVTINSEPLPISVEGGVPPFTWELIDSPGFSLEFSTTQDHNNILHPHNACGTATIRVIDSCARGVRTTEINVKSVRGQWNQIVPAYCAIRGPADYQQGLTIILMTRISGKYRQVQWVNGLGINSASCADCPPDDECLVSDGFTIPYPSYTKMSFNCYSYSYSCGNPPRACTVNRCAQLYNLQLFVWGCPP